jgi:hypothetical protein
MTVCEALAPAALMALLGLAGCGACSAPVATPESTTVAIGTSVRPMCRNDTTVDFDSYFWQPLEGSPRLCGPGDTITLTGGTSAQYVLADGSGVLLAAPQPQLRGVCY